MHAARQPGSLPGLASRLHYERHRPEQTTLYRLVQQHAASFIAHTEASTDAELPRFIKDEFDAFLECGILAHGFLRLRCGECGHDKLLAFSCKRRGFCPSCGARRMSQTAAHLVDHVIPHVPVRQWVLSLPILLCVLLATQPELVSDAPPGVCTVVSAELPTSKLATALSASVTATDIGLAVCGNSPLAVGVVGVVGVPVPPGIASVGVSEVVPESPDPPPPPQAQSATSTTASITQTHNLPA